MTQTCIAMLAFFNINPSMIDKNKTYYIDKSEIAMFSIADKIKAMNCAVQNKIKFKIVEKKS